MKGCLHAIFTLLNIIENHWEHMANTLGTQKYQQSLVDLLSLFSLLSLSLSLSLLCRSGSELGSGFLVLLGRGRYLLRLFLLFVLLFVARMPTQQPCFSHRSSTVTSDLSCGRRDVFLFCFPCLSARVCLLVRVFKGRKESGGGARSRSQQAMF